MLCQEFVPFLHVEHFLGEIWKLLNFTVPLMECPLKHLLVISFSLLCFYCKFTVMETKS